MPNRALSLTSVRLLCTRLASFSYPAAAMVPPPRSKGWVGCIERRFGWHHLLDSGICRDLLFRPLTHPSHPVAPGLSWPVLSSRPSVLSCPVRPRERNQLHLGQCGSSSALSVYHVKVRYLRCCNELVSGSFDDPNDDSRGSRKRREEAVHDERLVEELL